MASWGIVLEAEGGRQEMEKDKEVVRRGGLQKIVG